MVNNFDGNSLTSWGQRIFNGANGIAQTAQEATIFDGDPDPDPDPNPDPDPDPNPDPDPDPDPDPGTGGCSASYSIVNQWQGGFQGEVTVTAGNSAISGWTVDWTFGEGQSISQSWNADIAPSGSSISASNVSYNGNLSAGASTSFGFIGSWNGSSNSAPSVSCTAG
jgi:mannan endo-1,4-beta-mannosidase